MQYIGKAQDVASKIVEAFQSGNLPKALAPIFIRRKDGVPCRSWSWGNQLLCVIYGTADARGIRQWNEVGRWVKKGTKAFDILVPLMRSATVIDEDTKHEKRVEVLVGFKSAPVFGVESTDGKGLPKDEEVLQWINALPLVEVARAWGLNVDAFNAGAGKALGQYSKDQAIGLGVKNLTTWAHELMHAADHRLGNLKGERPALALRNRCRTRRGYSLGVSGFQCRIGSRRVLGLHYALCGRCRIAAASGVRGRAKAHVRCGRVNSHGSWETGFATGSRNSRGLR